MPDTLDAAVLAVLGEGQPALHGPEWRARARGQRSG